jgi:hypothetical protein
VRREADPSKGAPLDVAWHSMWEIAGPTYCLCVEGSDLGEIERIPYRAVLPAHEIVGLLAQAFRRRTPIRCVAHVRLSPRRGHTVTVLAVDDDGTLFHDPWPEGSLLRDGENELGIAAQPARGGWHVTLHELERCLHAVFVEPFVLAELQGVDPFRRLPEVLDDLGFFGLREIGRRPVEEDWEVEAQPGGFRDRVQVRFVVDRDERVLASLLALDRQWLDSPERAFGIDIARSVLAATIAPPDREEAAVLLGGVAAIGGGQEALATALSSGPAHLLDQARSFALTILGAVPITLASLAFTRLVARNGDDGWLRLGVESWSRTAGPLLAGVRLPAPWDRS